MLRIDDKDEEPGLHPFEPFALQCRDPEHQPPSMIHVPAGTKFVHYCPTCRAKGVIFGDRSSMGELLC